MCSKRDIEKLKYILLNINDIFNFLDEFGTIEKLLDSKLGWNAVNMSIMQICETLKNKISKECQEKYIDLLPIKESYYTRNYIAHDYENVNKLTIEEIIRYYLPELKSNLLKIIEELEK